MYRESIADEISPERMDRFFVKVEGGYRVDKAVRDLCACSMATDGDEMLAFSKRLSAPQRFAESKPFQR